MSSHKLALFRNISGGIFYLPDKSPSITADGDLEMENGCNINAHKVIFSDSSTQNTASCVSYSFFLDIAGSSYGAATVGLKKSISLDENGTITGWPILPHATGTYFNTFGTYINGRASNWSNKPVSYGHFQASNGEITHMHINYDFTAWSGFPIYIKAINYTSGDTSAGIVLTEFDKFLVGSEYIKFDAPIKFEPNNHIGIFIEDTDNGPESGTENTGCIIEGSLLVKLKA